ncbi:wolframin-like [Glandiceps talaboti]
MEEVEKETVSAHDSCESQDTEPSDRERPGESDDQGVHKQHDDSVNSPKEDIAAGVTEKEENMSDIDKPEEQKTETVPLTREDVSERDEPVEEKSETVSPEGEKSISDAAKSFFHSLLPENQTVLTQDALRKALDGAAMSAQKMKQVKVMEKLLVQSEALSEDEFINKAVNIAEGILPQELAGLADMGNLDTDINLEEYEKATPVQKILKYPGYTVKTAVTTVVDTVSDKGLSWLKAMVPIQQIQTLLLIFLYSVCTADTIIFVIPLFIQYVSFFSLIIVTLQMFQGKKKSLNLKAWAEMLKEQFDTVETKKTESQFERPTLKPYLGFTTALLLFVFTFSFVDSDWVPYSEFTIISLFFTVTCFFGLDDSEDHITLYSLILQVFSAVQAGFKSSDMSGYGPLSFLFSLLEACSMTVTLAEGFQLTIGLSSILHLVVPILMIQIAMKKSWSGVYQVLLPHVVCVMWLQVAVTCFSDSSTWGLMRGLFGWWMMVFLAPLMVLFTLLGMIIWFIKVIFITGSALKILISTVLLGVVLGLPVYLSQGLKLPFSASKNVIKVVLIIAGILSLFPALFLTLKHAQSTTTSALTWQDYDRLCGPSAINQGNMIRPQVMCKHLYGQWVTWQGNVTSIKIASVDNKAESAFYILPHMLSNWLRCIYGDPYPDCSSLENVTQTDQILCEMKVLTGYDCHMTQFDTLSFQISVKMMSPGSKSNVIHLTAGHAFKDSAQTLVAGDLIEFEAMLTSNLGEPKMFLTLHSLTSLMKSEVKSFKEGEVFHQHTHTIAQQMIQAVGFSFNFFFSPILAATDEHMEHME